ncbi:Hint domain-containing protein [Paracoccus sp. NSM]|uniref:Hint domain-containing protein n=1 Tax=Paracoccus sp. NSM TaxID=3457784 RepID=UPI0040359619
MSNNDITVANTSTVVQGVTVSNATAADGTPLRDDTITITRTGTNAGTNTFSGNNRFVGINLGAGNDTLIGEDMIWRRAGDPTVAFDNISMQGGNDSVSLFRSAFTDINMGDGNDTLIMELSAGRNVTMGSGDDSVRLGGDSTATLSDAELAQKSGAPQMVIDGGTGIDTLNLQGDWTVTLSSGNVVIDANNNGVVDAGDITTSVFNSTNADQIIRFPSVLSGTVDFGTITLSNGNTLPSRVTFANFEAINAVCFTAGTLIETARGTLKIEDLREGDLVQTRNGMKALRWIGKRRLDAVDLRANPKLLPVIVPAGAFGNGLPKRDISFSPQHRLLIRSAIAERMFGSAEVLVPVKQLVGYAGIDTQGDAQNVTYFHLMFDKHEIVSVEGIEAESLYPGKQALSFLSDDQLTELRSIFPEFDAICEADTLETAVPFLKGREARSLAARHAKNDRPFYG